MKKNKTCLVIYIGIGYVPAFVKHTSGLNYFYTVDMRENKENHQSMVYKPLHNLGYSTDTLLLTSKHNKYDEFVSEYNAIKIDYEDLDPHEEKTLFDLYYLKLPERKTSPDPHLYDFGTPKPGGRFLKLKENIPEYDLYVFLRSDTSFKISPFEMNVDFDKINYLWKEKPIKYCSLPDDYIWNLCNSVNGNVFNVVPKKYFKPFINYYWAEHLSLHFLLKDLHPLIELSNINFICGDNVYYCTNILMEENPVFTFNKTIMHSDGSITKPYVCL